MGVMFKEVKKPVKKSKVKESAKKPDNNFYTYTQMIEKKAYELYEKRGRQDGRDREDWFEAEKLVGQAA